MARGCHPRSGAAVYGRLARPRREVVRRGGDRAQSPQVERDEDTTKWFGFGAAALMAATAGGIAMVVDNNGNGQQTETDCRLLDTRAESQVGSRVGPIGPEEIIRIQATGDNGDYVDIPADATSLDIQLTARVPSTSTTTTARSK